MSFDGFDWGKPKTLQTNTQIKKLYLGFLSIQFTFLLTILTKQYNAFSFLSNKYSKTKETLYVFIYDVRIMMCAKKKHYTSFDNFLMITIMTLVMMTCTFFTFILIIKIHKKKRICVRINETNSN
mgnify:CR=1 FL=1